mmetsp:Transcript_64468/g.97157  ORF Transcript_64468/g.97157 Transcript_64468/m.97157 type:complete len:160 (+) Transcript_64468:74-553(+)|eukprot:CAMPEP_0117026866 /NCGR_PEP_ID=MMETSP0472-20121206/19706_1 /TAXON_ID=693140 ORGANISM="Tiarina fusus, Strain LIS" /NCGR_SAMPLE_ID=MMETSP0472 /ASSEMBLY_ACC=CAM_ASM_000603 /LENGTH=159 /DNA_ID=CAMNT_0004733983 /DNA_START=67 /DNA_END=546 /DNA_ORIENTATION=-
MATSSHPDTIMEDANADVATDSNNNTNSNANDSIESPAMMMPFTTAANPYGDASQDDDEEFFDADEDDSSFDSEFDSEEDEDDDDAEVELMQNLMESIKEQREENQRLTNAVIELHKNKKKEQQAAKHQAMFGRIMALASSPPTGTGNSTRTNSDNPQE